MKTIVRLFYFTDRDNKRISQYALPGIEWRIRTNEVIFSLGEIGASHKITIRKVLEKAGGFTDQGKMRRRLQKILAEKDLVIGVLKPPKKDTEQIHLHRYMRQSDLDTPLLKDDKTKKQTKSGKRYYEILLSIANIEPDMGR